MHFNLRVRRPGLLRHIWSDIRWKVFRRRATNQWKWRVRLRQVVTVILRRNQFDPIYTGDSATEHCGLIAGERSPDWLMQSAKIPRAFSYICYSLQLPLSGLRFFRLPLEWHTLRQLIIILLWISNRQRGRSQFTFFLLSLLLSLTIADEYIWKMSFKNISKIRKIQKNSLHISFYII